MIGVIYDSFNMQTGGVTVSTINGVYGAPPIDLQIENIAGADGGVLVDRKYRPRPIVLQGHITSETQLELETSIQQLNRALNKEEKSLQIEDEGTYTVFTATPAVVSIERPRGLTKANFSIEFMCAEPIGYNEGTLSLLTDTYTLSSELSSVEVQGSYKAEPLISLVINSFTGTGERSVSVRNALNFGGITISREWTAGDEVEINCLSLDVTVNGVPTEFSGVFPAWEAGSGTVSYDDTFTARDTDIVMTYTKRKL